MTPRHVTANEGSSEQASSGAKQRDAVRTRQQLLRTALRLFAANGYAATTVREIAHDADVNVALISRYFESKEGLFEACLTEGTEQMRSSISELDDLADVAAHDEVARAMAAQLVVLTPEPLLVLLRSSGDERAERIRLGFLHSLGERIAAAAGWEKGGDDAVLLRAQVLLATSIGIAVLRSRPHGPEPLVSATALELLEPLNDVVTALLRR